MRIKPVMPVIVMPLVIMFLVMPMIIMFGVMPVIIMFFVMPVIMFLVVIAVMPVIIMFFVMPVIIMFGVMPMIVKGAAVAECDLRQTMTVQQGYDGGAGRDAIDGLFKKGFQFVTDPEYQVGFLQLSCL